MKLSKLPVWVVGLAGACFAVPLVVARYYESQRPAFPPPAYQFPHHELARLDRDLQTRFARIPEKDFGIERVTGNQHELYVPESPQERDTIRQLRAKKINAVFYLMSRALWVRGWDGAYFKPIQGPVHLTGAPIQPPLPRAVNFSPDESKYRFLNLKPHWRNILIQPRDTQTNLPNGTPVPSPTPPAGSPHRNALQLLGNKIFEDAETLPNTAQMGITQKGVSAGWDLVAVPIRASSQACINCHARQYHSMTPDETARKNGSRKLAVGDVLGVAFYAYQENSALRAGVAQKHGASRPKAGATQPAPKP